MDGTSKNDARKGGEDGGGGSVCDRSGNGRDKGNGKKVKVRERGTVRVKQDEMER